MGKKNRNIASAIPSHSTATCVFLLFKTLHSSTRPEAEPMPLKLIVILLGSCLLAGCGDGIRPREAVTGTLTLAGKPVENALVAFIPDDPENESAIAKTDVNGHFSLTTITSGDGAMAGTYKIEVTKYASQASETSVLNKKYSQASTSGLTATIPPGGTTVDLVLTK